MDVLTSETCGALSNEIIKQVTSSWIILIDLEEAGWDGLDWIYLTQNNDRRHDIVGMVTGFALP